MEQPFCSLSPESQFSKYIWWYQLICDLVPFDCGYKDSCILSMQCTPEIFFKMKCLPYLSSFESFQSAHFPGVSFKSMCPGGIPRNEMYNNAFESDLSWIVQSSVLRKDCLLDLVSVVLAYFEPLSRLWCLSDQCLHAAPAIFLMTSATWDATGNPPKNPHMSRKAFDSLHFAWVQSNPFVVPVFILGIKNVLHL